MDMIRTLGTREGQEIDVCRRGSWTDLVKIKTGRGEVGQQQVVSSRVESPRGEPYKAGRKREFRFVLCCRFADGPPNLSTMAKSDDC